MLDKKQREVGFIPTKEKVETIRRIIIVEDDESEQSENNESMQADFDTQLFQNKRYGLFSNCQYPYLAKENVPNDNGLEENQSPDEESDPGSDPSPDELPEEGEINFVSINEKIQCCLHTQGYCETSHGEHTQFITSRAFWLTKILTGYET